MLGTSHDGYISSFSTSSVAFKSALKQLGTPSPNLWWCEEQTRGREQMRQCCQYWGSQRVVTNSCSWVLWKQTTTWSAETDPDLVRDVSLARLVHLCSFPFIVFSVARRLAGRITTTNPPALLDITGVSWVPTSQRPRSSPSNRDAAARWLRAFRTHSSSGGDRIYQA